MSAAPDGYAIERNSLFGDAGKLVRAYTAISEGKFFSAAVSGPPATGKTFLAEKHLPSKGRKFVRIRANANNLSEFIADHRSRRYILFADECDYIFTSEPLMNLLKLCLNPYGPRVLKDDNKKIDCKLECAFVLATNKRIFDPKLPDFPEKMHVHIHPFVQSRFQLRVPTSCLDADAYHYSAWLATDGAHLLRKINYKGKHLTLIQQNKVLQWWSDNYKTIDELSPRRIQMIAEYVLKFEEEIWQAQASTFLTQKRYGEGMPEWIIRP